MTNIFSLAVGLMFGFGLALSGMTHPEKVLSFLDVTGSWDPGLLFVLGGAVGVTTISFRVILKLESPRFAKDFHLPDSRALDTPLFLGSALFGIGWGISGYCPGPAIALLAAPNQELWVFLPALLVGQTLQHLAEQNREHNPADETRETEQQSACG